MDTAHNFENQMWAHGGTVYAVRLSHIDGLNLDQVFNHFSPMVQRLIVSMEGEEGSTTAPHIHMLIKQNGMEKDQIKEELKKLYPTLSGNRQFMIKKADSPSQLLKYTVKEGEFKYKGFTSQFIATATFLSRPKTNMKDEFRKLQDKVRLKQITFSNYILEYIKLKVKHGQTMYTHHIAAHMRQVALEVGEYKYENYAEKIEEMVFNN